MNDPAAHPRRPPGMTVHRTGRRRRAVAVLAVVVLLGAGAVAATRGTSDGGKPRGPGGVERIVVGSGPLAATVLRRQDAPPQRTIIFLHGWRLVGRESYRSWLLTLARRNFTVIVPRYQERTGTPPDSTFDNAVAGIRAALRRFPIRGGGVVVAGHSAGAAMATDYAAVAAEEGLPPARAVLAIYPGTIIRADEPPVTQVDPSIIPGDIRLTVMASLSDEIVGDQPARDLYAGATQIPESRRKLVLVDDPVAGDHYAPVLDTPAARRTFWPELDALLGSSAG